MARIEFHGRAKPITDRGEGATMIGLKQLGPTPQSLAVGPFTVAEEGGVGECLNTMGSVKNRK